MVSLFDAACPPVDTNVSPAAVIVADTLIAHLRAAGFK